MGGRLTKTGLALRVGVFAFLEIAGLAIFGPLLYPIGGYVIAAQLGTFAAAAVANAFAMRIYERGQLADIGLGWSEVSPRHLGIGLAGGIGAALVVLVPPLLTGVAHLRKDPTLASGPGPLLFLSIVLLFGAIGEELLFRGYGFQLLMGYFGPFATILPFGVIFGFAHSANLNFSLMGLINTICWGIVLGYAFLRSGDLWLPIGLHFGWNLTLPLFGVPISGFTMGVMGYAMRWSAGDLLSGGEYGPEASLLLFPVLVALFYGLYRAPIQRQAAFLLRYLDLEED